LVCEALELAENETAAADFFRNDSLALVAAPSNTKPALRERFKLVVVAPDASSAWGVRSADNALEQLRPKDSWTLDGLIWNVSTSIDHLYSIRCQCSARSVTAAAAGAALLAVSMRHAYG
jgi:hypothetical protein